MRITGPALALVLLSGFTIFAQSPTPTVTPDALQILEKVNSFYSGSFTQLLTLTLAILAFAGVILPIILQTIQIRSLRNEQRTLQSQIASEVAATKSEVKSEIAEAFTAEKENLQKALKLEIEGFNARFADQIAAVKGASYYLQAQKRGTGIVRSCGR